MPQDLKTIELQIIEIEGKIEKNENTYDCGETVVDLEIQLEELSMFSRNEDFSLVQKLKKRLKQLREDLDIVDPEDEIDRMFPDGMDDGYEL